MRAHHGWGGLDWSTISWKPYFFWLWIWKMFCSSCGQNCPLQAKYCHKCGDLLKQNVTEGAGSVDEGSKKDESGSKPSGSGIGAQFRARKEEDRLKHFRNKPGKKLKLDRKGNIDCQTKINIGVMIMKDGRLLIKRGYSLPINVTPNITSMVAYACHRKKPWNDHTFINRFILFLLFFYFYFYFNN